MAPWPQMAPTTSTAATAHHRTPWLGDHPDPQDCRPWEKHCPTVLGRDETLRATRHYGQAFWKRWPGYPARTRAEAKMRCLKPFGGGIAARGPDR